MTRAKPRSPPPRWVLGLLLAFTLGAPFVARSQGFPIGDWAMFASLGRYRLELSVSDAQGTMLVPVRSLGPHLSRDAKLVILPAAREALGKDQTDLLAGGLADLARLLCELYPSATTARARLGRGPISARGLRVPAARPPLSFQEASLACQR